MGHLQIARTEGAKAGFRAWVATNSKFGKGTAQYNVLQECLEAGNNRARFDWYCERFLNKADAVVEERAQDSREALIESIVNGNDEDGVQVVADDDEPGIIGALRRSYRSNTGTRRSGKGTSAFGVGTKFVYQGKDSKTTHEVVGEGKTKHGRKAWLCKNAKGNVKPWNKKSVSIYIEKGKITVK